MSTPALGEAVIAELGRDGREVEIAQRLVFPKLYGCVSGVSRDADGRCAGLSDPSHPSAGASGPAPFPAEGERADRENAVPGVRP